MSRTTPRRRLLFFFFVNLFIVNNTDCNLIVFRRVLVRAGTVAIRGSFLGVFRSWREFLGLWQNREQLLAHAMLLTA
jgi:hypothetical protein